MTGFSCAQNVDHLATPRPLRAFRIERGAVPVSAAEYAERTRRFRALLLAGAKRLALTAGNNGDGK